MSDKKCECKCNCDNSKTEAETNINERKVYVAFPVYTQKMEENLKKFPGYLTSYPTHIGTDLTSVVEQTSNLLAKIKDREQLIVLCGEVTLVAIKPKKMDTYPVNKYKDIQELL